MNILIQYGWSHFQHEHYSHNSNKEALPGRVISIKGFKFRLITEEGEQEAELSGKVLFGTDTEDLPAVGDWVLFLNYETIGYIVEVLPRTSALVRKEPGTKAGAQVIAANVDYALIVQGMDRDFNPRRIERYIVQLTGCGIKPVVILNKSDLVANAGDYVKEVRNLQRDYPILACSTVTGEGMNVIRSEVLNKGTTSILIGSSGAGKSSLLNTLMNDNIQKTSSVSDFTRKGKHTTSTRDLFMLGNGSLIIDSPGMREFGLTSGEGLSSAELFPAIASLAPGCRFSDCSHISESSCAVREALKRGELHEDVYISYLKLVKEQRHFEMNAADKKRMGKRTGKMIREVKDFKKRFKGG